MRQAEVAGERPPAGGRQRRGVGVLRTSAYLVVVVAGLKLAGEVIVPVIVAAFVTIICAPAVHFLKRRGVPAGLAVGLVLVAVLGLILLASFALVNSAHAFAEDKDTYGALLNERVEAGKTWLEARGVEIAEPQEKAPWDPTRLAKLAGKAAAAAAGVFSNVFLVLLIVVFMLLEASGLPTKIRRALGDPEADLSEFQGIGKQVWKYLSVKTVISLMVGVGFAIFLAVMGISYPVLWGLLAFLLNYIPNIGSLIAAIPPVLLALLTRDLGTALIVAAGNVVLNQVTGNILEPRMMGAKLGLSPLVVLLSLVFWGWLWGIPGMLLSVPLTMVVKIFLQNHQDLAWIALLLGPSSEEKPRPTAA